MKPSFTHTLLLLIVSVGLSWHLEGQTLLWSESFSGTTLPTGWAIQNNTANGWAIVNVAPNQAGSSHARHRWNVASNNYLFTKGTVLTAGNIYDLKYWVRIESASFPETYEVRVGNGQTSASQTTVVKSSEVLSNLTYVQKTAQFIPATTGTYYFSFRCTSDDEYYLHLDEVEMYETITCASPSATYTVVPNCLSGNYSVDVNIASTGDASGVNITDGTTTYESNVGIGTYTLGPFSAGSPVTVQVNGDGYGGCNISSSSLNESCVCSNTPLATTSSSNLDCSLGTYDVGVTVTNFGDGSGANILIDGTTVQSNAVLNQLYTFPGYATGSHTIDIQATGGSFVTCESSYLVAENCISNICVDAINILGNTVSADMSVAVNDNFETDFGGEPNYASCGNGTTIGNCDAGIWHSAYYETNYNDLWFVVDIPDGSDEFTVDITNFVGPGNIYILPYSSSGDCSSLTLMDIGNPGLLSGSCPTLNGNGSLTYSGTDVATASTNPIYLRIIPHEGSTSSSAGDACTNDLYYPTFDISASSPQPNDICSSSLDIDGVLQTGNFCEANTDAESVETCSIGSGCISCTEASETNDLWYSVTMDPTDSDQNLQVEVTFPNSTDAVVVTLYSGCFSNSQLDDGVVADCATLTSTGSNSTIIHQFDATITAGGAGPDWYIRIAPAAGNSVCNFSILANRVAENNDCAIMQSPFPGFDASSAQLVDFNFATESGAAPLISGNDLWYQFDPNTGSDNGIPVYSATADINVSGLNAGEELTVIIYQGNTVSSNNCDNLASDYLSTTVISGNGTFNLPCLDEIHGPANGGYLARIIQTAGASIASPTVTITPSAQVGKYNNSCINIWDGNSPSNLGVSDASHEYNAYYILDGETINGSFLGTTDCDSEITSSDCSGVSNDPFSEVNERDLWYVFRVPTSSCPSLTTSTVVDNMFLTYDASSSFRDAKLYVYSTCGDANLVACSPTLDGAGETWTATGLTQGEYYLLRVKPSSLNSDFDYSFTISLNNGNPRPCNNDGDDAMALAVNSCNDYDNLDIYSMKGANESPSTGVPENDVWFTFTAPSPANGGPYFNADKSWVSVFFENVSGTPTAPLYMQLYDAPSSIVATANTFSTGTSAGSQGFAHFGHLNPGQTYYLRLYSKEIETTPVDYKINVYTPNANETAWSCGLNNATITGGCSEGCNDLREAYFKIDLPEGTGSNHYYLIEVVGLDQILDFELRSQYLTESSANEGDIDDFDLPCSSRPVEAGVSITSETYGINSPLTGESCNPNGIAADGGEGVRRVYYGMNGPAAGMKDYYYIRVFMDPSDPNYNTTTGLNICAINFNGPYTSESEALTGNLPDVICNPVPLGVEDLIAFEGVAKEKTNVLTWEVNTEGGLISVLQYSADGISYTDLSSNSESSTNVYYHENIRENTSYYRIKLIDVNGVVSYSDIVILRKIDNTIKLFPNPLNQAKPLSIISKEKIETIKIKNTEGKETLNMEVNAFSVEIQPELNAGMYYVEIQTASKIVIERLVIQ